MKRLGFCAMLLTMCVGLNAQTFYGSRYKGYFDLNIGPGNDGVYKGTNALSFGLLNSHGYQFSPYVYVGAGFGINYHHTENFDNVISIPVFSNTRINFIDSNTSPYLDLKVGYSFYDLEGVFMSPSIGIKSSINDNLALNFQLGYSAQRFNYIEYDDMKSSYIHSVKLSLGIEW